MGKAIVRIKFDENKLEELDLDLESEIFGWLENSETGIYVESVEEIISTEVTEEFITLETYNLNFQIKKNKLIEYLNKYFNGITVERFLLSYTWDDSDYIRTIFKSNQ